MAERILVIDDDLTIIKIIGAVLRQQGYEVDTAITAEDGLQRRQEGEARPDHPGCDAAQHEWLRDVPDVAS